MNSNDFLRCLFTIRRHISHLETGPRCSFVLDYHLLRRTDLNDLGVLRRIDDLLHSSGSRRVERLLDASILEPARR